MIRVIGNKRLLLVVYIICVQPMLYPYAISVGRVVLSSLISIGSPEPSIADKDKTIHATTLELKYNIFISDYQILKYGNLVI